MYFIYTFFLLVGLALAAPYYLLKTEGYGPSLADRFGRLKTPQLHKSIWVHAVSVGEVKAVQQLLDRLRQAYPNTPLVLSTTTLAGHKLARDRADVLNHVFYFPFDLPWTLRRTLDRIDPALVIVAETEIWPNFLRACRERGVPVHMVNGRISDRSLPRYRLIGGWLKRVLGDYTVLGMQSEIDRNRIEMLGANVKKVRVFGNLKYDALSSDSALEPELASFLHSMPLLWIAASTKPTEEEIILDAFAHVRQQHPRLRLLIAPRRPQRFDEVEKIIKARGFECMRRSNLKMREPVEVLLLDSIGELSATFAHATVVFVGGSIAPLGGHNVLEPAAFSKPIIFGPHMENFRDISELFIKAGAAIQIKTADELGPALQRVLDNGDLATELGTKARRIVEQNTGATERFITFLQSVEART
jgi:3-deoxy-D-manno-octulosonic-acid transferase